MKIILEKKRILIYIIMFIFSDETFSHSPGCLLAEIKGTNTTGVLIKNICTVWALDKLETNTWRFSPEFSQISGLTKAFSPCPLVSAVSKDADGYSAGAYRHPAHLSWIGGEEKALFVMLLKGLYHLTT
jgi:hypothetical protein